MRRMATKLIQEGRYAAEFDVELIYEKTEWSPYLSPDEVRKLDNVRLALRSSGYGDGRKARARI